MRLIDTPEGQNLLKLLCTLQTQVFTEAKSRHTYAVELLLELDKKYIVAHHPKRRRKDA